jgi:transposase
MRTVALDLSAKKISYCEVRDGAVIDRTTVSSLRALLDRLGPDTPPTRVAFEAGIGAWSIHDELLAWGHQPFMLDTTRVRELGVGRGRRKTDRIDAETMALALERGGVALAHVVAPHRRELRHLLSTRRALVKARTTSAITIRGVLRARGESLVTCNPATIVKRLAEAKLTEATRALIAPLVPVLDTIDAQLRVVEAQLDASASREPAIQLLRTMPGVGPITAATFVSVIDWPERFRSAHQVEAYLGLVPAEDSSGARERKGRITKHGNRSLRMLLVEAAWSTLRARAPSAPLKAWAEVVAERRGRRIAAVALARRIAGILWAMWRKNAAFDAAKIGFATAAGLKKAAAETRNQANAIQRSAIRARRTKEVPR